MLPKVRNRLKARTDKVRRKDSPEFLYPKLVSEEAGGPPRIRDEPPLVWRVERPVFGNELMNRYFCFGSWAARHSLKGRHCFVESVVAAPSCFIRSAHCRSAVIES